MATKTRRKRRSGRAGSQYTGSEAIVTAARRWGVPVWLLAGVKLAETGAEPSLATSSSAGAAGPFGFMPATAATYHVDTADFASSADGAAHLLHDLHEQYGSWDAALEGYNAGPGNIGKGIGYDSGWIEHKLREFGLSKARLERAESSQLAAFGLDDLKKALDKAFGWSLGGILGGGKATEGLEQGDPGKILEGAVPLGSIGDFFSMLLDIQTWLRAGQIVFGAILIYMGLKTLTGTGISDVPGYRVARAASPV